jgi:lipopolysaccharide/colanic/teichoic acid biosynthesis glycosyltransferase
MLDLDLEYIKKRSLWLDLSIMVRTPLVMITGRGAG